MKLLNLSKKTIIPFFGILLILFLLGCGQRIVNNQDNNQFDGIWEMEYSETLQSFIDPGYHVDPINIELSSKLTFMADSFNLQIVAPNSYHYLNRECAGNYSISADTINFSISRVDSDFEEELHFNFISTDSVRFYVISTYQSNGMVAVPMTSFIWHTSGIWPGTRRSGVYNRVDIE